MTTEHRPTETGFACWTRPDDYVVPDQLPTARPSVFHFEVLPDNGISVSDIQTGLVDLAKKTKAEVTSRGGALVVSGLAADCVSTWRNLLDTQLPIRSVDGVVPVRLRSGHVPG